MVNLKEYRTLIFDCDGVILNSNAIKSEAFYNVAAPYGAEYANELVAYNKRYGGKSRYEKLDYFMNTIIGREPKPGEVEALLEDFSNEVKEGLMNCEIAEGIDALRKKTSSSKWMVVSGGDQYELRDIFRLRKIDQLFNAGIFGSPDAKEAIFYRELNNGNIKIPAIYLGDSLYDYQAAMRVGLVFIFVKKWSDFMRGSNYFESKQVNIIGAINDLVQKL